VIYGYQDLVYADIPGLIEGAHMGVGLGHAFLRHVARTRVLVHLLNGESQDPVADYNQINIELALYDEHLAHKPQVVVLNKMDVPEVAERWPQIQADLARRGVQALAISAMTRDGVQSVVQQAFQAVDQLPESENPINDELPVYELTPEEPIFTIERNRSGNFMVRGKRIERAASMTYWDHEESLLRFQKILEVLGISQALAEAGVKVGDTVYIGNFELEWLD